MYLQPELVTPNQNIASLYLGLRGLSLGIHAFQIYETVMVISRNEPIVIVGAGCFGISTAYHLLQRGFTDVTVLDRSERLPAPDAASTDLNKSE
jgi:hypothetical protein